MVLLIIWKATKDFVCTNSIYFYNVLILLNLVVNTAYVAARNSNFCPVDLLASYDSRIKSDYFLKQF